MAAPATPGAYGPDDLNYTRIGIEIHKRLTGLRWGQAEPAFHGGPSRNTVSALVRGTRKTYTGATLRSLSLALGWTAGSLEAIGRGGRPALREDPGADWYHQRIIEFREFYAGAGPDERRRLLGLLMEYVTSPSAAPARPGREAV